MPFNPFSPIFAKIFGGLSLALLIACGVMIVRGNHYRDKAENCQIARANDRKAYELASKEAEAKAIAQKLATENRYADLARKADRLTESRERMSRAADRYAQSHRVRPEAVERPSSGARGPGEDHPAQEPDRSPAAAAMVALTRPEFDELVNGAIRAEQNRQWAESLIREGLAIPEIEFGK